MGGTSMSNPLVAGAAAVVRDYYVKAHNHDASGALTKATLINSAVDLLDENNDGADDNDLPIPNAHEGWGRVDLAGAVDGAAEFVDDMTGVTTGATASYDVAADGSGSLKVTLVWADYPSTESAAINLVNDLDLVVTDPDGTVYHGNVFGGGWSQTGGAADRLNNVENVYVQGAGAGTWTVAVSGYNVPFGPQPFALVIDGGGTSSANNPPTASFSSSCTDLSCDFTDTSSDSDGTVVGWDWDFGDGTTSTAQSPSHTYTTGGTYTVVLTATDNDDDTNTTSNPVTVTESGGSTTLHVSDLDSVSVKQGREWTAIVSITVVDDQAGPVSGAVVGVTWRDGTTDSCTTGADGVCAVEDGALRIRQWTLTVSNVTHSSLSYAPGSNSDPDGDSDGTVIIITKP
jgi:PKD repeat protein